MQERASQQFGELVHFGLPLVQRPAFRRGISMITSRPNPGATERFIRRASDEGIEFSPDVTKTEFLSQMKFKFRRGGCGVFAALLIAVVYGTHVPAYTCASTAYQQNATAGTTAAGAADAAEFYARRHGIPAGTQPC